MLGRAGWALAPQVVDQPVDRDGLAGVKSEVGQQRANLRAAELEDLAVPSDLERSEQTNFEPPWVGYLRLLLDSDSFAAAIFAA